MSGRTGLPQIYTMESDGTNVQRMTDQGYAVSPAWSPNGQFLVLSWIRHYGPGAPGAEDIYHHGYCQQAVGATDARRRRRMIFRHGRRMAGTLCFSPAAPEANKSGPCWPMGRIRNS